MFVVYFCGCFELLTVLGCSLVQFSQVIGWEDCLQNNLYVPSATLNSLLYYTQLLMVVVLMLMMMMMMMMYSDV